MLITIYYTKDDQYLMDLIEKKAYRERKSKSAVILTILESYFQREKRLGEILVAAGKVTHEQVEEAIKRQEKEKHKRRLAQILVQEGFVEEKDVQRALLAQAKSEAK